MPETRADLRLAVDIGNTNTVIGLFAGSRIVHRWRLATRKDATVDEIAISLHGLLRSDAERAGIRASAMASVVPMLDHSWARALEDVLGRAPEVLDWVPAECFIDMRAFSGFAELRRFLHSLTPAQEERYREAARSYLASPAFAPFKLEAFVSRVVGIVAADAGLSL